MRVPVTLGCEEDKVVYVKACVVLVLLLIITIIINSYYYEVVDTFVRNEWIN